MKIDFTPKARKLSFEMRITEFCFDLWPALLSASSTEEDRRAAAALSCAHTSPHILGAAPDLLRAVCDQATRSLPARMTVSADIADDVDLPADRGRRLALIASELLANACAHAHPTGVFGEIDVVCRRDGDQVVLEICDDGVGMPDRFDPAKDAGPGLRLIRVLAKELGASVRFKSGACGLAVEVRMPRMAR